MRRIVGHRSGGGKQFPDMADRPRAGIVVSGPGIHGLLVGRAVYTELDEFSASCQIRGGLAPTQKMAGFAC
jgi:hypothetical protein